MTTRGPCRNATCAWRRGGGGGVSRSLAQAAFAGQPSTLAATQRMRTEPNALELLSAKMRTDARYTLLLCRPSPAGGAENVDELFRTTLIQYFYDKQAAGIIRTGDGTILYLFPPSEFVTEHLAVRAGGVRGAGCAPAV